jgi:hypothetical protein
MHGKLKKNDIGQWCIVDDFGTRAVFSAGDQAEVFSVHREHWIRIHFTFNGREYVAVEPVSLYEGMPAREIDIPMPQGPPP